MCNTPFIIETDLINAINAFNQIVTDASKNNIRNVNKKWRDLFENTGNDQDFLRVNISLIKWRGTSCGIYPNSCSGSFLGIA